MEVKDINSIAAMLVSNRSQKTEGQNGGQTALHKISESCLPKGACLIFKRRKKLPPPQTPQH